MQACTRVFFIIENILAYLTAILSRSNNPKDGLTSNSKAIFFASSSNWKKLCYLKKSSFLLIPLTIIKKNGEKF